MSKIEQLIEEIEEYVESCKASPFSNNKIMVNREELVELLVELRMRVPEEIKKYQKIISNQDAILSEARTQADAMLEEARNQTNEMVNEHEITQSAYAAAKQIVDEANRQAQALVDAAVNDANNIRQGAIQYTDECLKNIQGIIAHAVETSQSRFESFVMSMQNSYDLVSTNRNELNLPAGQPTEQAEDTDAGYSGQYQE